MAYLMMVDDDEDFTSAVAEVLRGAGHEVAVEADTRTAMASMERRLPDLVILDLLLPRKNGYEACFDIRALGEGLEPPILLMSAVGKEVYEEAYAEIERYAQGYLRKPFSEPELAMRLRTLLDG